MVAVSDAGPPPETEAADPASVEALQPIFGPYRLEEVIGRGGMGEIYRAYDTSRGRVVALKRLPTALAADPTFQARFRAEAALAARLHEPHVIPIHDFGEIDGRLYIDMRLVEGPDLATVLADGGPLPPERAVAVVSQVAAALDAAHAAGLVHRDIKPGNILVVPPDADDRSDFVYVADFGIARAVDGSGSGSLTSTGTTVGSLDYVAPERFGTDHGDHRADVYALGCVLHEALTARRPFPVEGLPAIINAHLNTPPPAPTALRPDLPAGLDAVVARAMAKNPDDRYPSAGALAADARRALGAAVPATPVTDVTAAADLATVTHIAAPMPPAAVAATPRRRWPAALAALATVAVLVAAVVTTQRLTPTTPGAAAPESVPVVTEPLGNGGDNPFMPPVTVGPPVAIPPVVTGGTVSGGTSGLYGGTLDNASCDPAQMVAFLQGHPDKARAWADVEGIGVADIPSYVAGLTPVVLRADTAVTNHGFSGGAATTLRSVLQAGTAVLVDRFGVPRARCYCGNPLTPPAPTPATGYTGTRWPAFDPASVVTIAPTPAPLAQLTLVDPVSLAVFTRPIGSLGASDQLQTPATTTNPPPTPSAEPPPVPAGPGPVLVQPPPPVVTTTVDPPRVEPPGPVQGLTSKAHNDSGSFHVDTSWGPPADMHGNELVGYRVTATSAAGTSVQEVSSPQLVDRDTARNCAPDLSYTVRAIGRPPGGGPAVDGEPATVAVTPVLNCTPSVRIVSATVSESGDVTVVVECSGGGRGGNTSGALAVQLDGRQRWTGKCSFPLGGGAVGSATYTAVISEVGAGGHQVTATSTSISGTRTAGPVPVTVG